ncbi:extensin-like [Arachis stenosperma]|uniref:extensin-like n=1 Tax=Arachis stenosperma TaxID=217475 RepID=UPI0025ABCCFD|nr:extensin-like [Arachis stenosperma]
MSFQVISKDDAVAWFVKNFFWVRLPTLPLFPPLTSPQPLGFFPLSLLLLFPQKPETNQMRKKVIAKRPPHEKVYKLPTKPSTRSQDRTFTPSPSPPTSPPRIDPMARTKNPSRVPSSAKQTPAPKEPPSKPGSSKPSSSKGKRPAAPEPASEPP